MLLGVLIAVAISLYRGNLRGKQLTFGEFSTGVQSGKFTKEWVKEYKGGLKKYNALLKAGEKHQIEKTGAYLRSMMPWMTKKNIKGVQAAYS